MMSKEAFEAWGWRIPFLLSILLVGLSLYIRLRMKESPIFSTLKEQGKTSTAPIRDSLVTPGAWKRMALTLFGATAGQGVVWYTGQFYALFYLQNVLKVDTRHGEHHRRRSRCCWRCRCSSCSARCRTASAARS